MDWTLDWIVDQAGDLWCQFTNLWFARAIFYSATTSASIFYSNHKTTVPVYLALVSVCALYNIIIEDKVEHQTQVKSTYRVGIW